jgi:hypothetical protein
MKKHNSAPCSTLSTSIPLGCKSYLQDWLKQMGISHSKTDIHLRVDADGWRCLIATILAEIVCAAAQDEDLTLSQEAKAWLQSPASEMMFEECNLNYNALLPWLAEGCPLPHDASVLSAETPVPQDYQGIAFGRLALERYDPILPEEIYDILNEACDLLK